MPRSACICAGVQRACLGPAHCKLRQVWKVVSPSQLDLKLQAPAEKTNIAFEMRVLGERNSVSNVGASTAFNKVHARAQELPAGNAHNAQQQAST